MTISLGKRLNVVIFNPDIPSTIKGKVRMSLLARDRKAIEYSIHYRSHSPT